MSRRRASFQPYTPLQRAAVYRQHYGERCRHHRSAADLTPAPRPISAGGWCRAVAELAAAVAGAVLTIVSWRLGLWLLAGGWS